VEPDGRQPRIVVAADRRRWSRGNGAWRVLAVTLALAAAVCLVAWADRSSPAPESVPSALTQPAPVEDPGTSAPVVQPPPPVWLVVPAIDVDTRLSRLGLQDDGAVEVALRDGSTASFVVRTVRTYPNADFPARRVYGADGRPELNLVTCGGEYDAGRGGYQANVVVNARLVSAGSLG
jgi:hypothetical protein